MTTVRSTPSVVRAGPADLEVLSDLIATAFHDLAPSRWLIADPEARRCILPGYFRLLIAYAMVTGLAQTIPSRDAVALWLPAGPGAPSPPTGHRQRLAAATAPWTGRFAGLRPDAGRTSPSRATAPAPRNPGRSPPAPRPGHRHRATERPPPRPRPRWRPRLLGGLQLSCPRPVPASRLHHAPRRPVPASRRGPGAMADVARTQHPPPAAAVP